MDETKSSLECFNDDLLKVLENNIKHYIDMFPLIPLNGVHWESILVRSLKECGNSIEWEANSHKVGEDIRIVDCTENRISVKGGRFIDIKKDLSVNISSFRTKPYI